MSHLIPVYTHEAFVTIESAGEEYSVPEKFRYETDPGVVVDRFAPAYWARLSAPGYLDATEWEGPFDTLELAKAHMRDLYDIDPDTGESLLDEE